MTLETYPQIRKTHRGQVLRSKKLNRIISRLNDVKLGGLPRQATHVTGVEFQQFRVKSIGFDGLVGHKFENGTEDNLDVEIALPYELQKTFIETNQANISAQVGGVSYTHAFIAGSGGSIGRVNRVAVSGSNTENQLIVPVYYLDAMVIAMKIPPSYSVAGLAPGDLTATGPLVQYGLIYVNGIGRAWAV